MSENLYIQPNWELAPAWATHFITETENRHARFVRMANDITSIEDIPISTPSFALVKREQTSIPSKPGEALGLAAKNSYIHDGARIIPRPNLPPICNKEPAPRGLLDW